MASAEQIFEHLKCLLLLLKHKYIDHFSNIAHWLPLVNTITLKVDCDALWNLISPQRIAIEGNANSCTPIGLADV